MTLPILYPYVSYNLPFSGNAKGNLKVDCRCSFNVVHQQPGGLKETCEPGLERHTPNTWHMGESVYNAATKQPGITYHKPWKHTSQGNTWSLPVTTEGIQPAACYEAQWTPNIRVWWWCKKRKAATQMKRVDLINTRMLHDFKFKQLMWWSDKYLHILQAWINLNKWEKGETIGGQTADKAHPYASLMWCLCMHVCLCVNLKQLFICPAAPPHTGCIDGT